MRIPDSSTTRESGSLSRASRDGQWSHGGRLRGDLPRSERQGSDEKLGGTRVVVTGATVPSSAIPRGAGTQVANHRAARLPSECYYG